MSPDSEVDRFRHFAASARSLATKLPSPLRASDTFFCMMSRGLAMLVVVLAVMQTPAPALMQIGGAGTQSGPRLQGSARDNENQPQTVIIREIPTVSISKDWADREVWLFSFFLVIVGGLQAWFLRKTLKEIHVQAGHMAEQTEILRSSVAAAQASADAANANINLVINKERARIFVEVGPFDWGSQSMGSHQVDYRITFHGSTMAFLLDSSAELVVDESKEPPPVRTRVLFGINGISKVIPPFSDPLDCTARLFHVLDEYEIERIKHNQAFIHFLGYIRYKDFMEKERETTFCYTWSVARPGVMGVTGWVKSGPPESNKET